MKNFFRYSASVILLLILMQPSIIFSKAYSDSKNDSLNSDLLQVIDKAFDELEVPGMIAGVWIGDEPVIIKALGVSDLKTGTPMSVNDNVRIGSITKTFTGTVLLQLVDEGKISLNDKLSKYFPDYPNGDNITIEMLGNMKSGIFNYSEDKAFIDTLMKNLLQPFSPQQLLDISLKHEPYFPPGTSFHYSNTNTLLLGMIIEKLTGNSLKEEIQNRIIKPLGLTNTYFAEDSTFTEPHSHGYLYLNSTDAEPTDVTVSNPSWGWAAGAIISNLQDVRIYAKKLATGELISKSSQDARLQWGEISYPASGPWKGLQLDYGFAIGSFGGALGHNGGIPGFNSFMGYIPEKDMTIIIFANMQDNRAGMGPADYTAGRIVEKVMDK